MHWLPDDLLEDSSTSLAAKLRLLSLGQEYAVKLRGVAQPAKDWNLKYHGTSWLGAKGILLDGFLGTYGAGMYQLWKSTGEDLPLVYTSPSAECAWDYPMALMDKDQRSCGEVVARDTCYLRICFTCSVNVDERRVKIQRGSNKQVAH